MANKARSFESMRVELRRVWKSAQILPSRLPAIDKICQRILANKARYEEIEKNTGVPWPLVAAWHYRESNLNFNTHLHCGDPLTARTVHVPKGRPARPPMNGKVYSWLESAYDALVTLKGLNKIKTWTVEQLCYQSIRYNGWGYTWRGKPSPYLLAGTNLYKRGKFVADGVYDPNHVDTQLGVVAIIKRLDELDPSFDLTNADEPVWHTVTKSKSLMALLLGGLFYAGTVLTHFIQNSWDGLVWALTSLPQIISSSRETVAMSQEVAGWMNVDWSAIGVWAVVGIIAFAGYRHYLLKRDLEKKGLNDAPLESVNDDSELVPEASLHDEIEASPAETVAEPVIDPVIERLDKIGAILTRHAAALAALEKKAKPKAKKPVSKKVPAPKAKKAKRRA